MKEAEFIEHLKKEKPYFWKNRVINISICSVLWAEYTGLKLLTKLIDFECNFDEVGCCQKHKKSSYSICCCHSCEYGVGHIFLMPKSLLGEYAKHFIDSKRNITWQERHKHNQGFWRRDKGCVLPIELRSRTCLTYNCFREGKKSKMLNGMKLGLWLIEKELKKCK